MNATAPPTTEELRIIASAADLQRQSYALAVSSLDAAKAELAAMGDDPATSALRVTLAEMIGQLEAVIAFIKEHLPEGTP